ncbi:phosphatidylinositol 4-phosphate 5-kinase-like protein 1 [Amphiura filiformis]|uniref:phosphatidylinositol 4-phosphate 5-kinase-like protein 1 n=1 Tax=Amphiura filiformis TaxID=82378 RepID=UPI003B217304
MATSTAKKSSAKRSNRGRFAQLISAIRRKESRQGIVEIDETHEKYDLACCMQEGLTWSPEAILDVEKPDLTSEDFSEVVEAHLIHEHVKKKFIIKSYAPKVFLCLRRNLNISEEFYQESMCPENPDSPHQQVFLQFISNSKSGQNFFLCNNKCYMIKTETRSSALFFLKILPKYYDHLERYPHSLLVRFLGLHFIKIKGIKGQFFTVMQSVFYPDERIRTRFDLKACVARRYARREPKDSEQVSVLKDINFGNEMLQLGQQKDWFCRQISIDGDFLDDLHVMDYSLLVGRHKLHPTEISQHYNMADVVLRVSRSYQFQQQNGGPHKLESTLTLDDEHVINSSNNNALDTQPRVNSDGHVTQNHPTITQHQQHNERDSALYSAEDDSTVLVGKYCNYNGIDEGYHEHMMSHPASHNGVFHHHNINVVDLDDSILPGTVNSNSTASLLDNKSGSITSYVDVVNEQMNGDISKDAELQAGSTQATPQNLRFLCNAMNASHIIDGPTERYYLGIIDMFTEYTTRKKFEHVLKAVMHPNISYSTVGPKHYKERFCKFFHSHCE